MFSENLTYPQEKENTSKLKVFSLFQSLEDHTRSADSVFPEIEEIVRGNGLKEIAQQILSDPEFRNSLSNPDMAMPLLIECFGAIGTPEMISTEELENLLEQVPNSLEWVQLNSFIQKRIATEMGFLSSQEEILRILDSRGGITSPDEGEEQLRIRFQKAIKNYPPDAYFSEYHKVQDQFRSGYFPDAYMDSIDLYSLLEERCLKEWGENAPVLAYVKESTVIKLAHNILAVYDPSGRYITTLDVEGIEAGNASENTLVDWYTMRESLEIEEGEDEADAAYRVSVSFFDMLPQEWQERYKKHFASRDVDIEAIAEQSRGLYGADVVQSASRSLRLFTPAQFGDDVRKYVEEKLRQQTQKLVPPQEIDLIQFNATLNNEYALPEKDNLTTARTLQAMSFESVQELERLLAIPLERISLREVFALVEFLKNAPGNKGVEDLQKLFGDVDDENRRIDRAKSFLSLEQGREAMGEVILSIAENLPQNEADAIFQQYARLVNVAENISNENENEKSITKQEMEVMQSTAAHILEKAKNMLVETTDALEEEKAIDSEAITVILEEYREDIIRTSALCKSLPHDTPLEAIEGLAFEKRSAQKYAEYADVVRKFAAGEPVPAQAEEAPEITDLRQIFRMIDRNYADRGEFRVMLKQGLAETLLENTNNTTLYFVRQDERILALARFEDRGYGTKYFGSFNVLSSAQQSSIAPKFFRKIIEEEGKESDIEATCDAFSTAASIYIEQGKFEAESIDDRQETSDRIDEKPWFRIRRIRDQHRKSAFCQGKSLKELRELYQKQSEREAGEPLLSRETFLLYIPIEELHDETSPSYGVIKKLLNEQSYSLTRFVRDGSSGLVLCAFERRPDDDSDASGVA